jgi:hypothetical protein
VDLERGPVSLVSTTGELLERKSCGSGLEIENTTAGISQTDHMAPSIRKIWHLFRRQAAVARSVYFPRGLRPRSLVIFFFFLVLFINDSLCFF